MSDAPPSTSRPIHFASFDEYVAAFPEAECCRSWLTRNPSRVVEFVALVASAAGRWDAFAGEPGSAGYWRLTLFPIGGATPTAWRVLLGDFDDGLLVRDFPVERHDRALILMTELRSEPFNPATAWQRYRLRRA